MVPLFWIQAIGRAGRCVRSADRLDEAADYLSDRSTIMAHDPLFEARIAHVLLEQGVSAEPKKMFGGVAFMVNGHMSVGITNKGLFMVRVDPKRYQEFLELPGARPMDFTHRPMMGFLFVEPDAIANGKDLVRWVDRSLEYVRSLPVKRPGKKTVGKSARRVSKAKGR